MKINRDIGSEITNKLENYKSSPDSIVWNNIEKKLKKRKRRLLFWYFFSAIALVAITLFTFSLVESSHENPIKSNDTNITTSKSSSVKKIPNQIKTTGSNKDSNDKNSYDNKLQVSENTKSQLNSKNNKILLNSSFTSRNEVVTVKKEVNNKNENSIPKTNQNTELKNVSQGPNSLKDSSTSQKQTDVFQKNNKLKTQKDRDSLTEIQKKNSSIKEENKIVEDTVIQRKIRWSINPQFIVSKYGAFNAKTENDITLNYGAILGYKISEKTFLRFGARKLSLRNTIDDNENSVEYLEIPLELKYSMSSKRLSPFVTIGPSFFRLQNDKPENSNDIKYLKSSLSLNLGVGLELELIDRLYLNLGSNFSYLTKSLSKDVNYTPYIFSINTGIDYRF
ncbi:porin family protein [Winogradskyella flava]|uniref:Porin family protein n=1 Tax=Winogradskyella flava TaxID=1884876 RepID=A0A842IRQ4_9FLAO|nr:porin family protein [Winogradskyella flava]MBC2844506.1 porin family protein [Winogradskyella flava]